VTTGEVSETKSEADRSRKERGAEGMSKGAGRAAQRF